MENETNLQKIELYTDSILDKKLEYKKEYAGQKTSPLVNKWKSYILKKFGKGGQFYFCKYDNLYYYADKKEAIYYKPCPICNNYFCPYCGRDSLKYYGLEECCIKGKIRFYLVYDIYKLICPKDSNYRTIVPRKPRMYNYIPFFNMCIFVATISADFYWYLDNVRDGVRVGYYGGSLTFLTVNICFGFFISIPYFLYHYIFILILLIISIFNKKPFLYYCGIFDRNVDFF